MSDKERTPQDGAGLADIVDFCDSLLRPGDIDDYKGAVNGLQVENDGSVTRIGAAVDASLNVINRAAEDKVDLLIVHHGLFWTPRVPWTGATMEIARQVITSNMAIYSSHLPLDVHPQIGNNVLLCEALGLMDPKPCARLNGLLTGMASSAILPIAELAKRLRNAVGGPVNLLPCGPETTTSIAVVTGGAGSEVAALAAEGFDTFITGEGPHWSYGLAQELRINVLYAGHYATETFGVKALTSLLAERFRIPWTFIDDPSRL